MTEEELVLGIIELYEQFTKWTIENVRHYDDTDFTFNRFVEWLREEKKWQV